MTLGQLFGKNLAFISHTTWLVAWQRKIFRDWGKYFHQTTARDTIATYYNQW
jgi:hypothetical protein